MHIRFKTVGGSVLTRPIDRLTMFDGKVFTSNDQLKQIYSIDGRDVSKETYAAVSNLLDLRSCEEIWTHTN